MPCSVEIRACAPYANVEDVRNTLSSIFDTCITSVDFGTDPADFIADGFGDDGPGECCGYYLVEVLGSDPLSDPSVFYLSTNGSDWYQVSASVDTCTVELPAGTLESNFLTAGWGGTAPSNCDLLAVQYDDQSNTWISPDAGVTWYRIEDDYVVTTLAEQSNSTTSTSSANIATPQSFTATKDHVYVAYTAYAYASAQGSASGRSLELDLFVTVAGTNALYQIVRESAESNDNYKPVSIGGRIECNIGDAIVVTARIRRNGGDSGLTIQGRWQGVAHV